MSSNYDLRGSYRITRPEETSAVDDSDIVDFWVRQNALPADAAQERVNEVCMVGLTDEGELCGLTTAYLDFSTHVRMRMWHVRGFVAAEHRASNVAANLLFETRDYLGERFSSGADTRASGILMEVENLGIERRFPFAVWPESWFAFVGVNPRGAHLRLLWFPDALVPQP